MIVLISGPTHTGKTLLAQRLLERYRFPYLSIDHLKMGLIRSRQTSLTPLDDDALTEYLWPIVREIIKTAVENRQNLIVEGCYIPYTWQQDFAEPYRSQIRSVCLVMSADYIRQNLETIRAHAGDIEARGTDPDCSLEHLLRENRIALEQCRAHQLPYVLIDGTYAVDFSL